MLRTCFIVAVSAGVALLAACGSDDDSNGSTTDGGGGSAADAGSGGANAAGTGGGGTSSGGAAGRGGTSSPDASTGGATGDGGSTGDGAPPAEAGSPCDQLAACCTPGPFEASCQMIASQGLDLQCSTVMGIFCMGNPDGGGGPGEAGVGDCSGLQACCDQLTGLQQTQCEAIVGTGVDMNCSTVAFLFCPP